VVALVGSVAEPTARRRVGLLITAGLFLTWMGDTTYQVLEWLHLEGDVTVADVPWLACYVAFALGLHGLLGGRRARRGDVDALIDMALAAVAAGLILWETVLRSLVGDSSVSAGVRAVWAAYPLMDFLLLVLLVRAMADRRSRGTLGLTLLAGISLWLVSDFAFLVSGGGTWIGAMDIGWILGSAFLAAATLRPTVPAPEAPSGPEHVRGWRLLLGLTPLLIPTVLDLLSHEHGLPSTPGLLAAAMLVLVLLAAVRGLRLLRSVEDAHHLIEAREHYFRALALNSSDAVLVLDETGTYIKDLHNLGSLAGTFRPPPASSGQFQLAEAADAVDPSACEELFDRAIATPGLAVGAPLAFRRPDGSSRWVAARMVNLLHDPHVGGVVINLHDVTTEMEAAAELEWLALHDPLTNVANRALLWERLEHALLRTEGAAVRPAVLFLDLDNFKTINDSLGHEVGDEVLVEVARRLKAVARPGDTVSRLGGDEFAVLIEENHPRMDQAATTAERLQQALSAPMAVGTHRFVVSASIGMACAGSGASASSLLRDADVAMYRAKSAGRACSMAFEPSMGSDAAERLELEADLTLALALEQFEIAYQPVIELATDQIVGFEALLRWNHPERGVVMPDRFIPITEESGSIVPIGRWVLGTACQQVAAWNRDLAHEDQLTLAVNLSARQLACGEIVDHVREALAASGLPASSLVLEMTETALISDTEVAAARLGELRGLGVKLAIDDFGTGFSSLSYLRQFPIDILKIDRSFTETIEDPTQLPAIVRGLLDLGQTLGLDIVAEGVEHDLQRDRLRDEQCRFGQGFFFDRPLTPADAHRRLTDAHPHLASSGALVDGSGVSR
jgi:diguanylate cyclase (GGDEF)-like protein